MQAIEAVKRTITSVEDLQSIVKTMKSLAAVSIRQYETAVAALTAYHRTIALGLQAVLRTSSLPSTSAAPGPDRRLGAIVFGSDQGLCGRFNDQVVSAALALCATQAPDRQQRAIVAVGARAAAALEESAQPVEATYTVPASLAGVIPMVQDLLLHIETWREQQRIERIVLVYNVLRGGATYQPQVVPLVPVDLAQFQPPAMPPWPSRALPMHTMAAAALQASLLRQHLFVALYQAVAESLASENASRLASMQAAENNIAERLEVLRAQFRYQRQSAITEELLDIVAGFEALSGRHAPRFPAAHDATLHAGGASATI